MNAKQKRHTLAARILTAVLILAMGLALCGFNGTQQKVYDQAGLLTQEQASALQQRAVAAAYDTSLDFVIVTTNDARGKSAMDYADDFYDDGNFGFEGNHGSGVLFLIDMDNREIYVSTSGNGILWITDDEVEDILDAAYDDVVAGDYYDACDDFIDAAVKAAKGGQEAENVTGEYNPDKEDFPIIDVETKDPTFWEKLINPAGLGLRGVISAIAAWISTAIMKRRAKTKSTVTYKTYQHGNVDMRDARDILTNTTVVMHRIERNTSVGGGGGGGGGHSSHHMSSGGHSHGGGGRGF
ncbi:MAG: TPM domain-containing protein [Lachnospiraceae bacterium]|nr:TPM domain-containing protein [Lachnospiraceae bacterium]